MTAHDPHTTTEDEVIGVDLCANYRPGQGRRRYRKSVDHTLRHGVWSMLHSVVRRDDFDVPDLGTLVALVEAIDDVVAAAVHNLVYDQGHSWQTVAGELGVTRQAAHQRFAARGRA